ncbi:MAG: UDP-N-acetylmuramoyl-tripeptide--D-alanyl-D-alanine ligase [bacterium]|nr:UDP-N-acetylmuramoyl-tripeptide--D-alanyl-D-alanine ligase [bacterium]
MKNVVRSIFVGLSALLAGMVIRKYHPKVVMVTGSVGKTSTKDALAATLSESYYLRASEKSYNSEFGVPFTIFGTHTPWKSVVGWLGVFKQAFALILLPNHYPNLLVLEVGADRPGDIEKILRIVTPDAVVVTQLPEVPVHVEAYASPEALREEEFMPAYLLPPGAPLIVCARDTRALEMAARVPAKLITYGTAAGAGVEVGHIDFYSEGGRVVGMQAQITTSEGRGELVVMGSVGAQQVLPGAAALAVALALHIPLQDALTALKKYVPPPGRGRVFAGMNGSILIDDSYNSSPAAVEEALKTLKTFPSARRRLAVLGDMLELGRYSVSEHERIGKFAKECADIVISVGIRARAFGGVHTFNDARSAAEALTTLVQPGDVVLIKGSQSIRTERIVEALLADPADREKLVRQEKEWQIR